VFDFDRGDEGEWKPRRNVDEDVEVGKVVADDEGTAKRSSPWKPAKNRAHAHDPENGPGKKSVDGHLPRLGPPFAATEKLGDQGAEKIERQERND